MTSRYQYAARTFSTISPSVGEEQSRIMGGTPRRASSISTHAQIIRLTRQAYLYRMALDITPKNSPYFSPNYAHLPCKKLAHLRSRCRIRSLYRAALPPCQSLRYSYHCEAIWYAVKHTNCCVMQRTLSSCQEFVCRAIARVPSLLFSLLPVGPHSEIKAISDNQLAVTEETAAV